MLGVGQNRQLLLCESTTRQHIHGGKKRNLDVSKSWGNRLILSKPRIKLGWIIDWCMGVGFLSWSVI